MRVRFRRRTRRIAWPIHEKSKKTVSHVSAVIEIIGKETNIAMEANAATMRVDHQAWPSQASPLKRLESESCTNQREAISQDGKHSQVLDGWKHFPKPNIWFPPR
jgi:hypothetical protein